MSLYNITQLKTKALIYSRNEADKLDIQLDGDTLEVVDEYKYLGSTITSDGRCAKEIRCRLRQARCAFQKKEGLTYFKKYRFKSKEKPTKDQRLERGTL